MEMIPPQQSRHTATQYQQTVEKVVLDKENKSQTEEQSQDVEDQQNNMASIYMTSCFDVLLLIFQYLEVPELLRAAQVCTVWRDLVAQSVLWKTIRLKNCRLTDLKGLTDTLERRRTRYLDMRNIVIDGCVLSKTFWNDFSTIIPRCTSLLKLELCLCPSEMVEKVIENCPQLKVLSAMSITQCRFKIYVDVPASRPYQDPPLTMSWVYNLKQCQELHLSSPYRISLLQDLTFLQELKQLTQLVKIYIQHLLVLLKPIACISYYSSDDSVLIISFTLYLQSLTSVIELGKKIEIIQSLTNLETLELGECFDFPNTFGTNVLIKLNKLKRLRLEDCAKSSCTLNILESVSKLQNLSQMELANFIIENGFDKCLAKCKNIKRLLIIPMYRRESEIDSERTTSLMLDGIKKLSNNLTLFVFGLIAETLSSNTLRPLHRIQIYTYFTTSERDSMSRKQGLFKLKWKLDLVACRVYHIEWNE